MGDDLCRIRGRACAREFESRVRTAINCGRRRARGIFFGVAKPTYKVAETILILRGDHYASVLRKNLANKSIAFNKKNINNIP